jgi:beta-glucanase (GH16 family)
MRLPYLILILYCLSSCMGSKKTVENPQWKLHWQDEFNYEGLPDSTKWDYNVGGHGWGNNELQYYTKADLNNAKVSNGSLWVMARKQKMENRDYTSARLVTKGKADFTYGKVEIRARLPAGRGLWPAIWMLGSNVSSVGWPECGEIDIMEHVGFEKDSVFGTIHSKAYNHIINTQKGKKIFIKDPYTEYHLFTLEWTPQRMDFLMDNVLYNSIANENKTTAEWPFDSPFYLLVNLAVGGNLGGREGVDEAVFPAALEVDYIRVYNNVGKNELSKN